MTPEPDTSELPTPHPSPSSAAPSSRDQRSVGDRRGGPRRAAEILRLREAVTLARFSAVAAAGAVACAVWALTHAPLRRVPIGVCGESLGRQTLVYRSLSLWWVPAVLLAVAALILPNARRRPWSSALLVGFTFGLGVAALLRVSSWTTGLCLA